MGAVAAGITTPATTVGTREPFRNHAARLAAEGWPVFPLVPRTKVPYEGSHGFKDATLDPDQIAEWVRDKPDANVGVRLPWEDHRAVVVLDEDKRGALAGYLREHGLPPAPDTRTVRTRRGSHRYYLLDGPVPLCAGLDGADVDVKTGRNGYVLAPGSVRKSGLIYRLTADRPVAGVPAEWLPHLRLEAKPVHVRSGVEHDGPTPGMRMVRLLAVKRPGQGRRKALRYFLGEAWRVHGGDPRLIAALCETGIRVGLRPNDVHQLAAYFADQYSTEDEN